MAGAPSAIWTDIYLSNRDALALEIDETIARLQRRARRARAGDAERVTAWNDAAATDRRRLLEGQLAGGPLFELRASVPNRPGVIAELALELGRAGVNITDMALYPAADMTEGVVALWISGRRARAPRRGARGQARLPGGAGMRRPLRSVRPAARPVVARRRTSRSRTAPRSSPRWAPSPCGSATT